MTHKLKNMAWALALMAGTVLAVSCSDDDDGPNADKTALQTTIDEAIELLETTEEGNQEGQYLAGAKEPLEVAVDAAEAIVASNAVTQVQVDNANVNLQEAIAEYEAAIIEPIAPANLVAHWRFDEGTGTTANDESSNGLDGTLKTGHQFWGAGVPSWTTDRYGVANKAIYFDKGANVEVPYNTKLNPQTMTISLWMKQDVNNPILNNQYMVALNRWNGWKLNMQADPKAFMTVKADVTGSANPAYYDRDNADPILTQNSWYHVVVTFGNGHMVFYVNGVKVRDWDNTPGTAVNLSATPVNLTIGQDLPTNGYSLNEADPNYLNWGGFFVGRMDEVRIYNTPLTETQVVSLYNIEKP